MGWRQITLLGASVLISSSMGSIGAGAQVVLDGTVGPAGAIELKKDSNEYQVTSALGAIRGENLFHSFDRFDIQDGESAVFSGPPIDITNPNPITIKHVLARVTGRLSGPASSVVDGTIRSTGLPNASFLLVNPKGILFGPNAQLDVPKAFRASSADHVHLGSNGRFDATDHTRSTLTSDPPSAFGFLAKGGAITADGSGLSVISGETLSLVGGDVTLTDVALSAPDGHLRVTAVAGAGNVAISASPDLTSGLPLGSVEVSASSFGFNGNLDTSGSGGGQIVVRAGRFYLRGGRLQSNVSGPIGGGAIDVSASQSITVDGGARIESRTSASGMGGNVALDANDIMVRGDSVIRTDAQLSGAAGSVAISGGRFELTERARINADTTGLGAGGEVRISTREVDLSGDTFISARTSFPGAGPAGNVVMVADAFRARGESTIDTSSFFFSAASGGTIEVTARTLAMTEQAWMISNTFTGGTGGTITLAAGDMTVLGTNAISTTTFDSGSGGDIEIRAARLRLGGSAVVSSGTQGSGRAGNVSINAGQLTVEQHAVISSETEGDNSFVRGAPVPAGSAGGGDGGNVSLDVDTLVMTGDTQLASGTGGAGKGGDVAVRSRSTRLLAGASITASSDGTGLAGDISVTAADRVTIDHASIATRANSSDGGNIIVKAGNLVLFRNATITTSVSQGDGNGGNISIDPPLMVFSASTIVANANGGNGGNILIVADQLLRDTATVIDASSALGIDGQIVIETPGEDVGTTLTVLPTQFVQADQLQLARCTDKTRADVSSLVVRGRDALPPNPDGLLTASLALTPLRASAFAFNPPRAGAREPVGIAPDALWALVGCGAARHEG